MKKISVRNLYLIFIICIGLVCLGVGSTYAVFTASSEIISPISLSSNLTYESGVLETVSVKVLPGEVISTKVNITNNSNSNLNYVTWYIDEGYDINVVGETGEMQGVISPLSTSTIVVSVRNSGDHAVIVNIGVSSSVDSIVLGKNMKVVGSANFMMGTEINPSDDTALFLRSNLQRGEIETITFVDNINIPEGNTSVDVSKHSDNSVMMWYGDKNSNNLYDIYIGAKNGTVFLSSGWCLFKNLTNVKTIEFSNCINTGNVTNMASMFNTCTSLTEIDVSNFDTNNVTNMNSMFYDCNKLIKTDLSNFDTSKVTDMARMFQYCSSLTKLDVSNFNTSKVTDMISMFYNCSNLTELDVSNFDTSKVVSMMAIFYNCYSLTELDVSNFETRNVTNMKSMFQNCKNLKELDVSNFETRNVTNMNSMFQNCKNLKELDVSNFDTSKVTNMNSMFYGCNNLISLDVSNFDTSNVIDMEYIFYQCYSLTELDVSNFDTSKVTNMGYMFNGCNNLTELNVSNFDTSNVVYMNHMFYGCKSLKELDLSNFDTSSVTTMRSMFYVCLSLTELDLSNFDTSNVTTMRFMFYGCNSLTELDLSSFDTSKVTDMYYLFGNSNNLKTIYVSDKWSTEGVTNSENMFNICSKLVGGSGTIYDANYIDKTYARVDKEGEPGYFTYKSVSV